MSEIKVNSIKGVGASTAAISVNNSDGTATANLTTVNSVTMPNGGFLSNKNLIINGAMLVAQRGTSSTSSGYHTVDRFKSQHSGTDEAPTQSQADVASGTTPYSLGFRKCLRITNGNQTSVSTSDYMWIQYFIEAQDIANSGWNYTSASSFITLSFWVKSSVAQDFKGYLKTVDGSTYNYPFATGSLTADTWTKITKTISGNSNLQFDNNNEKGFEINILPYLTTSYTDNSVTENAWAAFGSGTRAKDTPSDWWSADNATFEITGVQLEVGSVATDFEHRTFAQELHLCNRYYYDVLGPAPETDFAFAVGGKYNSSLNFCPILFPVQMRAVPTLESSTTTDSFYKIVGSNVDNYADHGMSKGGLTGARIYPNNGNADVGSLGDAVVLHANNTSACQLRFNAEL